jgi:5-methylcytosine-specific restriction endonuclease McrA
MNEQTNTPNSEYVKPCVKCGAQERNSRGKCKPCARECYARWAKANRERVRMNARKWQKANSDRVAENARKWREENPEKAIESRRRWREANPEKEAERGRRWLEANSEKSRIRCQDRRAKKKGNGGKLSKDIAQRLIILQKGKCACGCSALLDKTGYHLDHIMPIALGGKNDDTNVQLLTPTCNRKKSAKHPDDWARENGRLL